MAQVVADYRLQYNPLRLEQFDDGAANPSLNRNHIHSLKVIVPITKVRSRIVSILFAYDELIDNNNQRIALLTQMAEEIYKEWFVRLRFPGYKQVRIVAGVPEGWLIKSIKEIVDRKKFGKIYRESNLSDEGQIIVIDQSRRDFLGFYNGVPQHEASPEMPMILFGDYTCKMVLIMRDFSLAENVIPFVPIGEMPVHFLYQLIKNKAKTVEYKRHWADLTTQNVLIPSNDLQVKFSTIVVTFYKQIEILQKKTLISGRFVIYCYPD